MRSIPEKADPIASRLFTCVRLACGGAVAGLFVGFILGAAASVVLNAWHFGIDGMVIGGIICCLIGLVWGSLLSCQDNRRNERLEPNGPRSALESSD